MSETRRSDLNAQAIIGHHAHRPGFAAVIVLPDLSPLTVELASQIERRDGSYWKLWTPWQPRQKRGRPEWVTWSEPVPAMPFRKWEARQAEINALAGGDHQ